MGFNELLIAGLSLIHVAVHLKWKKIEYRILYYESFILLTVGLLGWIFTPYDLTSSLFRLYTGAWYLPVQPIDVIFMGFGLLLSTAVFDFLTKIYDLDRKSLLAVLPWTVTAQYRFLHELAWVFMYWTTMNVKLGNFTEIIPAPDALGGGPAWPVALLTHLDALLFIIFTIFNLIVVLQESGKRKLR